MQGALYCYCIWSVVNVFNTMVLDLGFMVHWRKCRLPGTEDMDREYKLLTKKVWWMDYMAALLVFP